MMIMNEMMNDDNDYIWYIWMKWWIYIMMNEMMIYIYIYIYEWNDEWMI